MRLLTLLFLATIWLSCAAPPRESTIFVGTYTEKLGHVDGKGKGVYRCTFDHRTGKLTLRDSTTGLVNPSYIYFSPNGQYLYVACEWRPTPERSAGAVAAYRVERDGRLTALNSQSSYGAAPCYVSTDRLGQYAFVANYGTGNVVSYAIRQDGSLSDSVSAIQHRAAQPHAHFIAPAPDNQTMWAVDKGANKVYLYRLNKMGRLVPLQAHPTAKDAGPRHLDFNPKNPAQFVVINELNSSLLLGRRDPTTGILSVLDSLSTLPSGFSGKNTCADVHFHPNGRFVYGSNRGHNSVVAFHIHAKTGKLSLVGHTPVRGEIPRNFLITPDGKWLLAANQNSSTVSIFKINTQSGQLTPVGNPVYVPTPVCLKIWPQPNTHP